MRLPHLCVLLTGALSISVWAAPDAPATPSPKDKKAAKAPAPVKARLVPLFMAEGLRFDPPRFEAKPGELLQIQVENIDPSHQSHNLVVVQPGKTQEVVMVALSMGESGPTKAFIPTHPGIIASSPTLVDPEKKLSVTVKLPDEPGVYGYVCTVPGHGMVMYGAIYAGVPMPPLAKDPNIPKLNLEKGLVGGGKRPFVQRMFLPEAGPAAIAVALPGEQNFCFDAGTCALRYAWQGAFLDATAHWRGNGSVVAELGDTPWWKTAEFPLRLGTATPAPTDVKFLGYQLRDGIPEFHYRLGKQDVFQRITPQGTGLDVHFRLPGIGEKVQFLSGQAPAKWSSPSGAFKDGALELVAAKAADFTVHLEPAEGAAKPAAAAGHTHHQPANP